MKVAIIVFSPTGNTLEVGKMLEAQLISRNVQVQLFDFTRNGTIFREKNIKSYLKENIKEHDLLCVGSPVLMSVCKYAKSGGFIKSKYLVFYRSYHRY